MDLRLQHVGRSRSLRYRVVLLVVALMGALLAATPAAEAVDGVTLRTFTADRPYCGVSTGIAFDGSKLYLSCWDTRDLYEISPANGARLGTVAVSGMNGIGALAWDRSRGKLWACDSSLQAVFLLTITGSSATAERRFTPTGGCIDGLAYDGASDTLFTSGDVASTVYHWDTTGRLIDSRYVGGSLGGCGSSGIAIGGGDLFLANNGCSEIYRAADRQDAVPVKYASFPRRIEDLECDDVTFRMQGKAAIWAQDAYDAEIHAFELNIGDCGYGGLPPSDGEFVYVAFGDSYQSGEGVGNSIRNTDEYLTTAYEDGTNWPQQVGAQQNTYIEELGGNSCHRALRNYAKLNRDRLEPTARTVLVDMTCSGAQIEPAGKPPIVGKVSEDKIDPRSQVQQAIDRLRQAGYGPEDVDLVTVGMGGNDAGFGDIVMACVVPALLEKILKRYPDSPGELRFVIDSFGSCQNAERVLKLNTGPRIDALQAKEEWAQRKLLGAFSSAKVLQVNYPDILPSGPSIPAWCGGIRSSDVRFARGKVNKIDGAIGRAVQVVGNPRLELVDIQHGFGSRALCSADRRYALANGMSERNVDREIRRLLDLDGDGDKQTRRMVDTLAREYQQFKGCLGNKLIPWDGDCDRNKEWNDVKVAAEALINRLMDHKDEIIANVIQAPGPNAEPVNVRFDRSRGMFHPNARGFEVVACNVRATYAGQSASQCLTNPGWQPPRVNAKAQGLSPMPVVPGDFFDLFISGLSVTSPIRITFYSEEVDLGEVMTDAEGNLSTRIQVPDLTPGVHRLQLAGVTEDGTELVHELKVEVPGTPAPGDEVGVYLCCFSTTDPDGEAEQVDVTYLGATFTVIPDLEGGVFLEVPVPGQGAPQAMITATSRRTGKTVTRDAAAEIVHSAGRQVQVWGRSTAVPPAVNTAEAGRALPIDFRVVDSAGAPVDDGSVIGLRSRPISCTDQSALGDAVAADDAGRSDLRGRGDGWWQHSWKTQRAWAGTCRTFTVALDGGQTAELWFSFR